MLSSFLSWSSRYAPFLATHKGTPENQTPLSVVIFFSNCFSHELPYLLWTEGCSWLVVILRHPEDFKKYFGNFHKRLLRLSDDSFLFPPHPLSLGDLHTPTVSSSAYVPWRLLELPRPVPSLELLTTCPSSWWICLDVPEVPQTPHAPEGTHCLHSQTSSLSFFPWMIVISTHQATQVWSLRVSAAIWSLNSGSWSLMSCMSILLSISFPSMFQRVS